MSLEQAVVLLLVTQIPLIVGAVVGFIKVLTAIIAAKVAAEVAAEESRKAAKDAASAKATSSQAAQVSAYHTEQLETVQQTLEENNVATDKAATAAVETLKIVQKG